MNDLASESTYYYNNKKGNPDFTLFGLISKDFINSWAVETTFPSLSDHRYISFTLKIEPTLRNLYRYKINNDSFQKFNREFIKYQ